jgi:hypothetical protein
MEAGGRIVEGGMNRQEAARQAGMVVGGQKEGGGQRQGKNACREEQELTGLQVDREAGRSKQGVADSQECMQAKTRSNT